MQAFDALKSFFKSNDATIALPGDPFVVVDRDKAISRLDLDRKAQENGQLDYPQSDAERLDEVESEIVAEITDYAHRAQIEASNNHKVYRQRLSELALLRELSLITGESEQAIGDYKTTVISRTGRLANARDAIAESYDELKDFKHEHGLTRPAHVGLDPLYAWSVIGISWVVETLLNTAFLRVNDEYGIIGGAVVAAVVAGINVFISALVGIYWWPYLFHKDGIKKTLAVTGCLIWFMCMFTWNLFAAHFRDAKSLGVESPETAAYYNLISSPFGLDNILSIGILLMGFVFAILAAFSGFRKNDPYPGYGAIYKRHEDRCDLYSDEIENALEDLRETRDKGIAAARQVRNQLQVQFNARGQIIAARETQVNRYREHQDYLESVANTLLSHYRAENRKMRSTPVPNYFNQKWSLQRNSLPSVVDEPTTESEVLAAQETLDVSIERISVAFSEAIDNFPHLDEIKRSLRDG